jgi:hypothetical protein
MVRKTKKGFKLVIRCDVCGKEDTRDIIDAPVARDSATYVAITMRDLFDIKKKPEDHR